MFSPGAEVTFNSYLESRKIKITGHRGAGFLEPENTIRAIKKGIELGVDLVEIDVRLTKDHKAAVIHDDTLDRTTNGKGKVSDFTLDELRKLDAGKSEKIPTLDGVIAATQGKVILHVELKDDFLEEQVVAAVKRKNVENSVIVISFSHERLRKIKSISSLETGLICVETGNNIALAKAAGAGILLHNFNYMNKKAINNCRKAGLKVGVWNPDTEEDISSMIRLGPDIISSNRPDLLIKLIRHHDSHDEFVDIVDESDSIIGTASWKEMNEKNLLHRTSNTIVLNSKGKLFVHQRAEHLKLYPGLWDVKFGGSVRSGESYEDAAKRELFEDIGLFDEDYFIYYEDVDLAFRARLAGWQCLYVPQAIAFHHHSWSLGQESSQKIFFIERNKILTILKNWPIRAMLLYAPLIIGYDLMADGYYILLKKDFSRLRAKLSALRQLPRVLRERSKIHGNKKISAPTISKFLAAPYAPWVIYKRRCRLNHILCLTG